jgi:hypothetical protein
MNDKLDAKFYGEIRKAKDDTVVPEDQWVCFLAKDNAFAAVLPQYLAECIRLGADKEQIDSVIRMIQRVHQWRYDKPEMLKVPDARGEKLLG